MVYATESKICNNKYFFHFYLFSIYKILSKYDWILFALGIFSKINWIEPLFQPTDELLLFLLKSYFELIEWKHWKWRRHLFYRGEKCVWNAMIAA